MADRKIERTAIMTTVSPVTQTGLFLVASARSGYDHLARKTGEAEYRTACGRSMLAPAWEPWAGQLHTIGCMRCRVSRMAVRRG